MKTESTLIRVGLAIYLLMFFTYLLGPLILMGITAFNSASFPQVTPWEVLTFEWFHVLFNDKRILNGLKNSFIVGFFTVILSVAIGLAGALMLTQIWPRIRATYYTIIIAPILIPGVVLGISTLVFWDRINVMLGFSDDSFLHNGIFLTVLGHSTFISSYCMLVFVARLQRYDVGLTEAALDLGATHVQAFRKIQLPFLMPAVGSAAVLAFLASFENYNTTTFTFQKYPTLTIELAQKVRYGINPSISALAFIIVCLTVFFALVHEVRTRRAQLAIANGAPVGAVKGGFEMPKFFAGNPAAAVLALFIAGAVATIAISQVYDPEPAKAILLKEKRAEQKKRIEALQERLRAKRLQKQFKGPDIFGSGQSKVPQPPSKTPFGNVFDPGNLGGTDPNAKPKDAKTPESPGKGTFGDVFNPGSLETTTGTGDDKQ
ncbi:MAG: ABC transporter permease [Rhizobiales bacterium]|nr:ABC transporter permease [Hyphomicrobiales bacterium]